MNKKIKDIFLLKAKNDSLGHLYQVSASKGSDANFAFYWVKELVESIILADQNKSISLENHPDITILNIEPDQKSYSAEELLKITKACHFKANDLKRKYIIINEAYKISDIQANKLLKTFEEPPIPVTIFLINNTAKKLLTTISSRSLRVILKDKSESTVIDVNSFKDLDFTDFVKRVESENIQIQELLSALLATSQESSSTLGSIIKLQKQIKVIEEDILFNNSSQYSLAKIHHALSLF